MANSCTVAFKAGDTVVLTAEDYGTRTAGLSKSAVYKVREANGPYGPLFIEGSDMGWQPHAFARVEAAVEAPPVVVTNTPRAGETPEQVAVRGERAARRARDAERAKALAEHEAAIKEALSKTSQEPTFDEKAAALQKDAAVLTAPTITDMAAMAEAIAAPIPPTTVVDMEALEKAITAPIPATPVEVSDLAFEMVSVDKLPDTQSRTFFTEEPNSTLTWDDVIKHGSLSVDTPDPLTWKEPVTEQVPTPAANPVADDVVDIPASVHPAHYSRWAIQPIEFIAVNDLPWWLANIVKYGMRYDAKDGLIDLYKARAYLDCKVRQLEGVKRFWEQPVSVERALNDK
jgi:hypothetical protein